MLTECLMTTFPTRISMSIQFCRFFLGDTTVYFHFQTHPLSLPQGVVPFPLPQGSSRCHLAGAESRVDDECAGSHTWKAVQRFPKLWWNQMDTRIIQDPLKRHFQHQTKCSIAKQHIFWGGPDLLGLSFFPTFLMIDIPFSSVSLSRLLQHLDESPGFDASSLLMLAQLAWSVWLSCWWSNINK